MKNEWKEFDAELFEQGKYGLGEGPFFDVRYHRISWVDIEAGRLWTLTEGVKTCLELGQPLGAAVPLRDSEGFVLAARDGLYLWEKGKISLYRDLTQIFKPYWRCNDAKADGKGRIWFGACVGDGIHEAEGNLYVSDGKRISLMQKDTKIANGMAVSRDRKSFYFSDSLEYAVFRYDFDEEKGVISNRKVLFSVENGVSDGMCIDADDNLWVAVWDGSRIEKRDGRTGEKLAEIRVPAKHVTSCCFMGEGSPDLLITTSGSGLDGKYDGCLFKCRTDAVGPAPDYVKIQ